MDKHKASKADLLVKMKEAGELFKVCARKTKILATLAWKPEVAKEFFKKKENELPAPTYSVDKKNYQELLEQLEKLGQKIQGEHPVLKFLNRTRESFANGIRLLLEIEKDSFYELSTVLYGNSKSTFFSGTMSNIELSRAISSRIAVCNLNDIGENITLKSAEEFAQSLEEKIQNRFPMIPVRVEVTDQITAKVVAGMNRVRIRQDARFSELELDALWNHEIESHCLTAHNGNRQSCDFLSSGGPRTTLTQEGLAVFYEVYGHTMSQRRFLSLCDRVEALRLAEEGANFIDVYRWYKERGEEKLDAFYNTQRIFRGGKIEGKGPFTKDVVYLAGLLGVYNFLRIAVKNQNRLLVESLVCGRISLEDIGTVAWMRTHGLLSPPYFVPEWLKNWEALLSFFSLTAVFSTMDLSGFQSHLDDHYKLDAWDLSL